MCGDWFIKTPHAFAAPRAAPAGELVVARGAGPDRRHLEALERTEAAVLDELLGRDDLVAGPLLQVNGEEPVGLLSRVDHVVGFGDVDGDGFFDEDVGAGLECVDGDRGVEGVGDGDGYGVRLGFGYQLLVVREGGAAELFRAGFGGGEVDVGDADEVEVVGSDRGGVHVEDVGADADDCKAHDPRVSILGPWGL